MSITIMPGDLFREPLTGTLFLPLDYFDGEVSGTWLDATLWPFDVGVFSADAFERMLAPTDMNFKDLTAS